MVLIIKLCLYFQVARFNCYLENGMEPREAFPILHRIIWLCVILGFFVYRGVGEFSKIDTFVGLPLLVGFIVFYDRIHNFLNGK